MFDTILEYNALIITHFMLCKEHNAYNTMCSVQCIENYAWSRMDIIGCIKMMHKICWIGHNAYNTIHRRQS